MASNYTVFVDGQCMKRPEKYECELSFVSPSVEYIFGIFFLNDLDEVKQFSKRSCKILKN